MDKQETTNNKPARVRPQLSTPESRARYREMRRISDEETKIRMDQLWGPAEYDPSLERACKFCKKKGLHWKQDFTGRWRLHDGHIVHNCAPGAAYSSRKKEEEIKQKLLKKSKKVKQIQEDEKEVIK